MENRKNFETITRICGNFCTKNLFFFLSFFWSWLKNLQEFWELWKIARIFLRRQPEVVEIFALRTFFFCSPRRIHLNKLFVPPQNLFLPPPSNAILALGLLKLLVQILVLCFQPPTAIFRPHKLSRAPSSPAHNLWLRFQKWSLLF